VVGTSTTCAVLATALALAGCSGLRDYANEYEKNGVIRVRTDPGTLLSKRAIDLNLYTIDTACNATYLGSLQLSNASIDLGLPLDHRVLLAYVFSRSAIIGTSGTTVIEMILTPRRGHRYEFDVSYLKAGYTATGLDFAPGESQGNYIEHSRLRDCEPADRPARTH
jgi:hypothetical protein